MFTTSKRRRGVKKKVQITIFRFLVASIFGLAAYAFFERATMETEVEDNLDELIENSMCTSRS